MEPQDTLNPPLLLRYLEAPNQLTTDEQAQVEQWLHSNPQHQTELNQLQALWEQSGQAGSLAQIDTQADWRATWERMQRSAATVRTLDARPRFAFWRIAAAVALLITALGGLWYLTQRVATNPLQAYVAQDTVMTVALPDGSQVFLNEGGRLAYEDDFGQQTRTVQLEGEGYFEIAHDPTRPFVIRTGPTYVRVVGTMFNVREEDQEVKVTVRSGTVAFSYQQDTVLLTHDEVGTYQEGGSVTESANDSPNYLAWQTGVLAFNDTPLTQVVQDLSRYYRVPMRIDNDSLPALTFTSTLNRQPLEEVLEELRATLDIDYTYQNDQVTLR